MAGVALLAGGDITTAVRLGASMIALQFAIGALNDIVDSPVDAGRMPPKPIPAGLVSLRDARNVAAATAAIGVALAVPGGLVLAGLAFVVLAIGAAYDLRAKGTAWSWLPFTVGIPILPVYGWLGATGTLPAFFGLLIPMAVLAGAGLSVANALADIETDRLAGVDSVAVRLGATRAWWVDVALMAGAIAIGVASLAGRGWNVGAWTLVGAGTGVIAGGVVLCRWDYPLGRERGWEAQAIGAAIAAAGWIAGIVPPAN